jgi:phosphatidate cytidylyltransferase
VSLDPALARFLPVLAAVLALAGGGVLVAWLALRGRKPDLAREIALRYATWVGMAALTVGALALGRVAWIALVALLALLAFREYARAVGLWRDRAFLGVVYVFILLIHVTVWWPYPNASGGPGWYGLFMAMPIYGILFILAVPIVRGRHEGMLQQSCLAILGLLYFGWLLAHLAFLVDLPGGVGLVLFVGFLVAIHDVAAFVSGKALGRHKLRPTLSPGKTWEGTLGAFAVVMAAAFALRWLAPAYPPVHLAIVAALLAVGATMGDLALSVIKRDLGIKDWSHLIPGHGGILDRLNSLLFAAPIFFHYTRYFFT